MFNRHKIEQLNNEIESLKTRLESYKISYRNVTVDLNDSYVRQMKEKNEQLSDTIKDLQVKNKLLIDENIQLRTAYNTEVLVNDKLRNNFKL